MKTSKAVAFEAGSIALLLSFSLAVFASPPAIASSSSMCGASITASTTLTGNVGPCPSDGLVISASDVVLNCNGYTVTGSGPETGIQTAAGVSGATIENCRVTNFVYGILLGNGGGDKLLNNEAFNNTVLGFFIVSDGSLIRNNVALENAQGGFAFVGSGNSNGYGYDNKVLNNKAIRNGQSGGDNGFGFIATVGDTVTNNKAVNNSGGGFYVSTLGPIFASGNTFTGNKAIKNGAWGFQDYDAPGPGTSGTANYYHGNVCEADASGLSSPTGLC